MTEACTPFTSSLNDRVRALLHHVEYFRIQTAAERRAVYQLRYRSYLREGAISARPDETLSDGFDDHENTIVLGLRIAGDLVATIRLHVLTAARSASPTMQAFGDILTPLVESGQTLIDPTRFAVDADAARLFPDLPYVTLRLPFVAAGYFLAHTVLAAVRAEHMPFYRRVLRCSKMAEPRPYLQLSKPLGLMLVNYRQESAAVIERYPFFAPKGCEAERLFR